MNMYVTRSDGASSHARCAIVGPIATMRVQSYAGSRVAESAPSADTRSVCVIRTT